MQKHWLHRNRVRVFSALVVAMILCAPLSAAHAELEIPNWRAEVRPGFAWMTDNSDNLSGFSLGMMGSYRVFDTLSVKLDSEISFFDVNQPGQAYWVETSAGVNYDIDLTPLVPTIGTGIGPLFKKPKVGDWSTEATWHVLLGLSYFIVEEVALGAEIRPHFILSDLSQDPFYFTVSAKVMMAF
jgi:hypothetical protein